MDYKKIKTVDNAVTRNLNEFNEIDDNVYETVVILSKRANQIATDLKEELTESIKEFTPNVGDSLEEVFENKEQIEIAEYYERMPKPTLLAVQEFLDGNVYWKNPQRNKGEF